MKKILLVADIPGWALDTIATSMINSLNGSFKFTKIYSSQYRRGMNKCFDETYFMQWNDFIGKGDPSDFTALITSHNYYLLHHSTSRQIIPKLKKVATSSLELYKKILELNSNVHYCPHGVDEKLFIKTDYPLRDKFIVGHVGQKLSANAFLDRAPYDMKGVKFVFNHVKELLKNHPKIEFKTNHKTPTNALPLEKMPEFYQDIDVQLCTRFREGTPFPALESASTGRALISTRVGCVPEIIKHGENGLLVDSFNNIEEAKRTAEQIVEYILFLNDNRDICKQMGEKNRIEIEKNWTWDVVSKNYFSLFGEENK